jgi:HAD superfamily hydrolase (TIGR01509 family)
MGLTLAIATNGMPTAQRGRYTRTGMDKVIPNIFISMELGVQKPMPAYFDKVCDALGVTDRSRVVMVGDSLSSDIKGGNNAGIDTIWYNLHSVPLSGTAVPTYTVKSYDEILAILS